MYSLTHTPYSLIHTYAHTHSYTHIHIHTYTHSHTHTPHHTTHVQGVSDLTALCQIMCATFVDHCPVYSKAAAPPQQTWNQPVRPPSTYATPNPYGGRPPYQPYPPQQQQYPGERRVCAIFFLSKLERNNFCGLSFSRRTLRLSTIRGLHG